MIALVRSELLKLRTLRSTAWAAAGLLAIVLLTASFGMGNAGDKGFSTPGELREPLLALGYAAAFFLAVLGANAAAGEYRHGTISQRFLASPARSRVLVAKLATYAGLGALAAVVALAVAVPLAQITIGSKDLTLDLAGGGARMVGGVVLAAMLAGMLGVIAGALTRNPATAMVAIFGGLIAEKVAGGYLGGAGRFLPYALIENVLGLNTPLAFGSAVLALTALTAALAVVAQRLVVPRDVT